MKKFYVLLLLLIAAVAAADTQPVSIQSLLQNAPKETSPQGSTRIVTVRGGMIRTFSLHSTVRGPKGDKGDIGPQGPQGLTGPQGPQGVKGDAGPQGPQGVQGSIGPQGLQGPTGPQGQQGTAGGSTAWRGAYSGGTVYSYNDAVSYSGGSYIYINQVPTSGNAPSNTTYWNTLALQGGIGPQGPQGIQGVKGDTGATGPQGPQGIQGVKGDTGLTGPQGASGGSLRFLGAWGASTAYQPLDSVTYQGSSYAAILANTNVSPSTDSTKWQLMASKGDPGAQGAQGVQGPAGPTGSQGVQGPTGATGATGAAGPNTVSTTTATNITGILKGNGTTVGAAVPGTDYLAPTGDGSGLSNVTKTVTSISALRSTPGSAGTVYIRGHSATGDGGEGVFRYVSGASAGTYTDDNGVVIVPSGGDGSAAWLRNRDNSTLNALWYGLDKTGTVDVLPVLRTLSGDLFFPEGTYKAVVPFNGTPWVPLANTTIRGAGKGRTIIKINCRMNTIVLNNPNVTFKDLTIQNLSGGGTLLQPNANNITLSGIELDGQIPVTGSPAAFTVQAIRPLDDSQVAEISNLTVENSDIHNITYGFLRGNLTGVGTIKNLVIRGNHFHDNNGMDITLNSPSGSIDGVEISGNIIENNHGGDSGSYSHGISMTGGKNVKVSGNTIRVTSDEAIHCEENSSDLIVTGNTITSPVGGITVLNNNVGGSVRTPARVIISGNTLASTTPGTGGATHRGIHLYIGAADTALPGSTETIVTGNTIYGFNKCLDIGNNGMYGLVAANNTLDTCTTAISAETGSTGVRDNIIKNSTTGLAATYPSTWGANTFQNTTTKIGPSVTGFSVPVGSSGWTVEVKNAQAAAAGYTTVPLISVGKRMSGTLNATLRTSTISPASYQTYSFVSWSIQWDGTTFHADELTRHTNSAPIISTSGLVVSAGTLNLNVYNPDTMTYVDAQVVFDGAYVTTDGITTTTTVTPKGLVAGPSSSAQYAIATYADATGKTLLNNSALTYSAGSLQNTVAGTGSIQNTTTSSGADTFSILNATNYLGTGSPSAGYPMLEMENNGGISSSKEALPSAKRILMLRGKGFDGSASAVGVDILAETVGLWTTSNHGTDVVVKTAASGSAAYPTERLRINGSGITVTGDVTVTGNVDGVDVSAHAADVTTKHLPSQSGANGKWLNSNGSVASWQSIPSALPLAGGSMTGQMNRAVPWGFTNSSEAEVNYYPNGDSNWKTLATVTLTDATYRYTILDLDVLVGNATAWSPFNATSFQSHKYQIHLYRSGATANSPNEYTIHGTSANYVRLVPVTPSSPGVTGVYEVQIYPGASYGQMMVRGRSAYNLATVSWGASAVTGSAGTPITPTVDYVTYTGQLVSTVATGTPPLAVTSTTKVLNLNVEKVDDADLDTDTTLAANSDLKFPSQKAIKAYIAAQGFAPLLSPAFTTPSLGVATATSINKVTITQPATSATLTVANGKTLTASNSVTLSGTDGSTLNIGDGGTLGSGAFKATTTTSAGATDQGKIPLLDSSGKLDSSVIPPSTVTSGTYTPTMYANNNLLSAPTPSSAIWVRVGNVVTVTGSFSATANAYNAYTEFGISLPVTSAFTSTADAGGTGAVLYGPAMGITASTSDPRVIVKFNYSPYAGYSMNGTYTFSYVVK